MPRKRRSRMGFLDQYLDKINYVWRMEILAIVAVILLLLYIFYSLRLIGPKS